MTAAAWTTMPAGTVRRGDVVKLGSGTELAVTRVEAPFLGRDDLVCLIEDSATRWLATAMAPSAEVTVRRAVAE
jgi:hypothetical protein